MNYLCVRKGYRVVEVPIVFVDRRVGKSKMSSGIVAEAMMMVVKTRLFGAPSERLPSPALPEVAAAHYSEASRK